MSDIPILFNKAYLKVAKMEKSVTGFRTKGTSNPEVFKDYFLRAEIRLIYECEVIINDVNSKTTHENTYSSFCEGLTPSQ